MSPEVDEQVDYFEHPLQTTCDWGLRLERDNQMGCGIFCMSGRFGDLIGGLEFCWEIKPTKLSRLYSSSISVCKLKVGASRLKELHVVLGFALNSPNMSFLDHVIIRHYLEKEKK